MPRDRTRNAGGRHHVSSRIDGEFVRRRINDVKIIALNPFLDLAAAGNPQAVRPRFQPVYLASNDDQKEGDEVFAIGNPLGLEALVSRGIIAHTRNRHFQGLVFIQTTTQINPATAADRSSIRGRSVGVTNMKSDLARGWLRHPGFVPSSIFARGAELVAFDNNPNTVRLDPAAATLPRTPNSGQCPCSPGAAWLDVQSVACCRGHGPCRWFENR